jgi:hypothetical protein
MVVVIGFMYAGRTPWALHIGGRSTWDEQWDGYGEVRASNGGRYVLFAHLQGGMLGGGGPANSRNAGGLGPASDNLHGNAELCTASGATHTFRLAGVVDSWWATDGARTGIGLSGGTPVRLPSGWVVSLHGAWHGPSLDLENPDNSFTMVFTPRGEIRRVTSTADAGSAHVTLQYGSHQEFAAACRALQHR